VADLIALYARFTVNTPEATSALRADEFNLA
jgi:hypothetical protein